MTRGERIIFGLGIVNTLNSQGRVKAEDMKRLYSAKAAYDQNPSDVNYRPLDMILNKIANPE